MSLDSLEKLFIEELKDVYNAEKQILRALPRMAKTAESPDLRQAFTKHLRETEGQVKRLERIFKELGEAARGKKC
jgi:ferritin-like metal-binding protein YciE